MSLEKNSSIVEEALLQIKNLEDAINENAKGILASTMKEEISELVRESISGSKRKLREQEEPVPGDEEEEPVPGDEDLNPDEEEIETDIEGQVEYEDGGEEAVSLDFQGFETEPGMGDNEMPPLNMIHASNKELFKVFKHMGEEDGIIVVKDEDNNVHLSDNNTNSEYIIQMDGNSDQNVNTQMIENVIYEIEVDDKDEMEESYDEMEESYDEMEESYDEMEESYDEMGGSGMRPSRLDLSGIDSEETVYEIDTEDLEGVMESFKAKGMGMGKVNRTMPKSSVNHKGFKEDKPEATKGGGRGPKFKYPNIKQGVTEQEEEVDEEIIAYEGWEDDDTMDAETTEASRTMTYRRRAERNRVAAPRQVRSESVNQEMNLLREKNEEYKKALDFFRNKLNEVAVFNSNLAYSTRLFTEHSTTKQEKINILRRFDNVETLKESKSLYKSIKNELDGNQTKVVTESIERQVIKTPSNGSSSNLIENKTYENPQFMRMKDLMTKIK
jgi:hypothetical protein